jgi:(p)ppGpp synthase/HD superfamily hydrolase
MRIIDAHYGYLDAQLPHTHSYVIPVNLRKIRGKVMELLTEPAQMDQDELNHPLAIELEKQLFDKLNNTQIDLAVIQRALVAIKKYHGGVKRKSGEPFFTHPMAVALILLDQIQDQDAVIGALLHDTVEDTSLSLTQIKAWFGDTVAFIVSKVTNLEDNFRRISLDDHENLHRLTTCEDKRVALVKLSDRLHNMRTIKHHSSLSKQKKIANETLNFFVPMAKQHERFSMAKELEKLCVEVLSKED